MQSQRLRMVSDNELRLEQFQAERKAEKRRYEDAIDQLKQVHICFSHKVLMLAPCIAEVVFAHDLNAEKLHQPLQAVTFLAYLLVLGRCMYKY